MGLIRGGLVTIVSAVLFLSLFAGNVFLTLNWSLEYDTLQPELFPIIKNIAEEEMNLDDVLNDKFVLMESYCQNNSEYVLSEQEYTFIIPCNVVSQGSEAVVDYGINDLVRQVYYMKYDCDFWKCVGDIDSERPFVFISEKAKDYWKTLFYFALIASVLLVALIFFLVEEKHRLFIIVGTLLAVSSLPFMKLNWLLSFISGESFFQFFTVFFTKAYNVFLITFIAGLAVLALGFGLKLFKVGFKVSDFLSKKDKTKEAVSKKEVKSIVKEEVSKKK